MTITDFRPLNPWGRPMPAPKRPYRSERHALYQVEIELRSGGTLRFGPKWHESAADMLCETVNKLIRVGAADKAWGKASVVMAKPAERHDTRTIDELLSLR